MKNIQAPKKMQDEIAWLKRRGKTVGFVPTLGALHEGHLSLVAAARRECSRVVVSIFVNPLQFGPTEDFGRYPRNERRDLSLLRRAKVDVAYVPDPAAFYAPDFQTRVEVLELSQALCGRTRPAHFKGVATVVAKLLGQVRPDRMYLGQKDYQQVRVLSQLVRDLDIPVHVRMVPTRREKDGLAMSSRNIFLNQSERAAAPEIYKALKRAKSLIAKGERDGRSVVSAVRRALKALPGVRLDYAELVCARTLRRVVELKKNDRLVLAAAVYFRKTRLIDNMLIKV